MLSCSEMKVFDDISSLLPFLGDVFQTITLLAMTAS